MKPALQKVKLDSLDSVNQRRVTSGEKRVTGQGKTCATRTIHGALGAKLAVYTSSDTTVIGDGRRKTRASNQKEACTPRVAHRPGRHHGKQGWNKRLLITSHEEIKAVQPGRGSQAWRNGSGQQAAVGGGWPLAPR